MEFNMDIKTRDEIIFGSYEPEEYSGGARRYEHLSLKEVKKLIDLKFMDPDEAINNCPPVREFVAFMERFDGYTVSGYTIINTRGDYRVDIDAISKEGEISKEEENELYKLSIDADEQNIGEGSVWCWWD